ncbi:hypothetical protein SAMN05428959_102339 [Duganella sp. CF517]|uniref:hypothetical protein n=1 Tax=Duganella sp. CF517 TaxID=1881038 RepID=UPI0008BD1B7A|nr:hypothetical protein [Duganella sp. CF517]SEN54729.1 hypothetical protein SAMN05428959_102339 [Duganella sp. CF517]
MFTPTATLRWVLFIFLLSTHLILTWKAFELDWLYLEIAALAPVIALEEAGIKLDACRGFTCMPGPVGWTLCLAVWSGVHYLAATLLSMCAMKKDAPQA